MAPRGGRAWLTDKYIYLMLTLFPLYTGFSGYMGLTLAKFRFLLVATGLWLAGLVFFAVLEGAGRPEPNKIQLAVIGFFLACCLSAALSPYGSAVISGAGRYEGLLTISLYILIFLGVSAYGRPKAGYVLALGISCTLCCAVAVLQLLGFNALWLFPYKLSYYDSFVKYSSAFLGTIGNTNLLSGFLCLAVPLMASFFVVRRDALSFAALAPAALGVFTLTASGVSGGLVGLLACLLVAAPLLLRSIRRLIRALLLGSVSLAAAAFGLGLQGGYVGEAVVVTMELGAISRLLLLAAVVLAASGALLSAHAKRPAARLRTIFGAISLIAIVLGLCFLYLYPFPEGGTLYELSETLHGNIQDDFGSKRVLIWRRVLELVPERPLLGGGPDTLPLRLELSFSRYYPALFQSVETYVDNAHNEYLGHLVNVGALGLGLYLLAICLSGIRLFRKMDDDATACLGCSLVCYWVQGFFGLGLCIVAPLMWLLWGLFAANIKYQEHSPERQMEKCNHE